MSINVKNISKIFAMNDKELTVLHDISLSIRQGEFFCIVGPSGCGKTTLLRIMSGLETATSGEFIIEQKQKDRPVNSMVFQEQSVFPWMNVLDNVAYGLRMRGIGKLERNARAAHYIDMIGLTKFTYAYPSQLSGGMKQRVSVARALCNDPEILLMDEPFGALDEQTRLILQQELLKIWEDLHKTTVFITHSIDECLCLGDRVMIMTAHPGTIKTIIDIDLPRPRDVAAIRTTMRYNELYQQVWLSLREEVQGSK
ncbi:MAG: ABC transporter ATP-binding protein [Pelosinus sp.]|nr:ABC transporter ATP-binding protein [Pelosinus sp.]